MIVQVMPFFRLVAVSILLLPFDSAVSQSSTVSTTENELKVRLLGVPGRNLDKTIQWQILNLALQKSGRTYNLELSEQIRAPRRAAKQMQELGSEANIIWAVAYSDHEHKLNAIRIPILGGLLSYRQIFVRANDIEKFSHIESIKDLKEFSVLAAERTKYVSPFLAAGFDTRFAALPNLASMVSYKRADTIIMPMMANGMSRLNAENIDVVPLSNVLICLPMIQYFYTINSGSQELRDAIATGLTTAIEDGSHNSLIRTHFSTSDSYDALMQGEFKLLYLDNPYLTEEAELSLEFHDPELSGVSCGVGEI